MAPLVTTVNRILVLLLTIVLGTTTEEPTAVPPLTAIFVKRTENLRPLQIPYLLVMSEPRTDVLPEMQRGGTTGPSEQTLPRLKAIPGLRRLTPVL